MKTEMRTQVTAANLFSFVIFPWILLRVWYLKIDRGSPRNSDIEEPVELGLTASLLSKGRLVQGWWSSCREDLKLGEEWTRRWFKSISCKVSRPVSRYENSFYYCCVFNPNMGASGGDVPAFFSSGYFSTKQDLLL